MYNPPAELLPYHVIVKYPKDLSDADGLMSHAFVFAVNQGDAINQVTSYLSENSTVDIADAQFTCKQSTHLQNGVYEM